MSKGFGLVVAGAVLTFPAVASAQTWGTFAGNPQHTTDSPIASQSLLSIRWSTPVDLNPQFTGGGALLIHYGSPVFTNANTAIVPVKTGATDGFEVRAIDAASGAVKYTLATDYALPPHNWTPAYQPTLTPAQRLYYPGAGGTVYFRDTPDLPAGTSGQVSFVGAATYAANKAAFDANVHIDTGITTDATGNIYFGYHNAGGASLPGGVGTAGGIARITPAGAATFSPVPTAAADASLTQVMYNCTPALSNDGSKLYIAVRNSADTQSSLLAVNSTTLAPIGKVNLTDPGTGFNTRQPDDAGGTPMVAPDGDVYYGVLDNPLFSNHARGWMLHFNSDLSTQKTPPGDFGWDDTPTLVPAALVPSYHGASAYLIMTKYNNYPFGGGDGINKLAVLDPNDTQVDPQTGKTVMKEILSIVGPTADPDPGFPDKVEEWCINSAALDLVDGSILANSEDGILYRWDLATNSFTEQLRLSPGLSEVYTPTAIGPDGTVYAIQDATLFAVGVPEPTAIVSFALFALAVTRRRHS